MRIANKATYKEPIQSLSQRKISDNEKEEPIQSLSQRKLNDFQHDAALAEESMRIIEDIATEEAGMMHACVCVYKSLCGR